MLVKFSCVQNWETIDERRETRDDWWLMIDGCQWMVRRLLLRDERREMRDETRDERRDKTRWKTRDERRERQEMRDDCHWMVCRLLLCRIQYDLAGEPHDLGWNGTSTAPLTKVCSCMPFPAPTSSRRGMLLLCEAFNRLSGKTWLFEVMVVMKISPFRYFWSL